MRRVIALTITWTMLQIVHQSIVEQPIGEVPTSIESILDENLELPSLNALPCDPNCRNCKDGTCSDCRTGSFLDGGVCKLCPANCLSCNSFSNCTFCSEGSYLYPATVPGPCLACPTGCDLCFNSTSCQRCKTGYTADNRGLCSRCGEYCSSCTSPHLDYCLTCLDGQAPDAEGGCEDPKPTKTIVAILVISCIIAFFMVLIFVMRILSMKVLRRPE